MLKVVDSHHKVLLFWAEYRKTLEKPPRLITLDHHTDTSSPFRMFIQRNFKDIKKGSDEFREKQQRFLNEIDFTNLNTVVQAIEKLNNDEHIVAAITADIISSAFVLAHNAANTGLETYKEHKIVCRTVNEVLSKNGTLIPDHDTVLESSLLKKTLFEFDEVLKKNEEALIFEEPFILDIDLDYFNTFKSIKPKDVEFFKNLVERAGLLTIATEPEYVESCAIDKGLTSKYLLEALSRFTH